MENGRTASFRRGGDRQSFGRGNFNKPGGFNRGNSQWRSGRGNFNNRGNNRGSRNFSRGGFRNDNGNSDFTPRFNKPWQQKDADFNNGNDNEEATVNTKKFDKKFEENVPKIENKTDSDNKLESSDSESETDNSNSQVEIKTESSQKQDKEESLKEQNKTTTETSPNWKSFEVRKQFSASTVTVANIPPTLKKAQLYKLFSRYGKILQLHFEKLHVGSYAHVVFEKPEDALKAVEVHGMKYQEHYLNVYICSQKIDDSNTIFVQNFPRDCKDNELWAAFESCGPILKLKARRAGSGFVCFEFPESLERALQMQDVTIRSQKVEVTRYKGSPFTPKKPGKGTDGKKRSQGIQKRGKRSPNNSFTVTVKNGVPHVQPKGRNSGRKSIV